MAEVEVPDIGDFSDVPVIEVLVSVGEEVEAEEQGLVTLESDKATMDVPAPEAGTVEEILVEVGDTVSEGIADPAAGRGRRGDGGRETRSRGEGNETPDSQGKRSDSPGSRLRAGRRGRRLRVAFGAADRAAAGGRPREVRGTGRKGRITVEDVERPATR